MSDYSTTKGKLKGAVNGTDPDTSKAITDWLNSLGAPAAEGAAARPADDDDVIIIKHP